MKIHEYQAKELFRQFGVPVPDGGVAFTVDEAVETAEKLNTLPVVVKAQIHAGGRGKGGGVKLAKTLDEAKQHASDILGMQLVTHQTGPEGKEVKRLLVEQGCDIDRELYLGMVLDRAQSKYVMMASVEGGMEIEEVAANRPEAILREAIHPLTGLTAFQARRLAFGLGLTGNAFKSSIRFMNSLVMAFFSLDCSLMEINPMVVTKSGDVLALDAKVNFDDNAAYRHKEFDELRDPDEEDPAESAANDSGLNYVKLDGNVGCMVNGAGLAMATMDIIKLHGGMPANFLDVGGGANVETVKKGFELILSDPNVKAVLINIFGGIVRCDRVAQGVLDAVEQTDVKVPVIVRLEGTNKEEGQRLLDESDLSIISAGSLEEAAKKSVEAIN